MKTQILYLLAWLPMASLQAQLKDDFSDGNYTANPSWTGTNSSWSVSTADQLQSANTTINSTYYLSTENTLASSVQWELSMRLQYNTSSANYTDIFLIASASDLTAPTTMGYFVRIGNTQDEISLYRKDGTSIIKIIDGTDGITNKSDNTIRLKVVRDKTNNFTLFHDATGTGNNYVTEGTLKDDTYTTATHFGMVIKQSTATFFQKHFFDNITIKPYAPDTTPPAIQSIQTLSSSSIEVIFDEPINAITAQTLSNYTVNTIGAPYAVLQDATRPALVHLLFSISFTNGVTHTLTIHGVADTLGNSINNAIATFNHYTAQRFDVVIDEIMADPSPPVGQPNAEYIELKNASKNTINLKGWRFTTSTSASGPLPSYELPADSFLILTANTSVTSFPNYLRVLGVSSFPTLDNTGTLLSLLSNENKVIHALAYSHNWHNDPEKEDGGWSLEMIDSQNPCDGAANWKSSNHSSGGTPGQKNAVDGRNSDTTPPVLLHASISSTDTLVLTFNETLDSVSAVTPTSYAISNSISLLSVTVKAPLYNQVYLKLNTALLTGTSYTVKASGILDCKGNGIGVEHILKTGLPEEPIEGDLIINELLFNPKPNSEDYIELYNKSNKIIDASNLYLANRNGTGAIASQKKLSEAPFFIYPGSYVVITENKIALAMAYHVNHPEAVLEIPTLPSYPDTEGRVVLLHQQDVLDEVHYTDDWHFDLIANKEGISLERIDPTGPSQDPHNWHSAASTAGYGTPGYQNSQWKKVSTGDAQITIATPVFSPDNDGHDDVALIQYSLNEPGYVANISLFDTKGVIVRHLIKNGTLGIKGSWTWDGLNEQKQKLPMGTYIVYTELFNLQGKKVRFKQTIVLARR